MVSLDFDKNFKKLFFFQSFLQKIIHFLYEIEFYMKNAFFWCIICWCRSKIAKFWNFAHFLAIFSIFSIFAFFLWFVEKKSEKGSNQLEMIQNYVETWFLTFLWLQSREKWGGPQGPPPAPGKASRTSPLGGLKYSLRLGLKHYPQDLTLWVPGGGSF